MIYSSWCNTPLTQFIPTEVSYTVSYTLCHPVKTAVTYWWGRWTSDQRITDFHHSQENVEKKRWMRLSIFSINNICWWYRTSASVFQLSQWICLEANRSDPLRYKQYKSETTLCSSQVWIFKSVGIAEKYAFSFNQKKQQLSTKRQTEFI